MWQKHRLAGAPTRTRFRMRRWCSRYQPIRVMINSIHRRSQFESTNPLSGPLTDTKCYTSLSTRRVSSIHSSRHFAMSLMLLWKNESQDETISRLLAAKFVKYWCLLEYLLILSPSKIFHCQFPIIALRSSALCVWPPVLQISLIPTQPSAACPTDMSSRSPVRPLRRASCPHRSKPLPCNDRDG